MSGFASENYEKGVLIVGGITFFISWIACTVTGGFIIGFGLGWIPSLILAFIIGFLWPVVVIAIGLLIALIVLLLVFGG